MRTTLGTLKLILKEYDCREDFLCFIAQRLVDRRELSPAQGQAFVDEVRARLHPHYTLDGTEAFKHSQLDTAVLRREWLVSWIEQAADHIKMPSRLDRIKAELVGWLHRLYRL